MRAGDTDSQIAKQQLLGRPKVAEFSELASRHDWLQASVAMPRDETIASSLEQQPTPQPKSVSSVAPWRAQIATWVGAGVQTTAIHAAQPAAAGYDTLMAVAPRCNSIRISSAGAGIADAGIAKGKKCSGMHDACPSLAAAGVSVFDTGAIFARASASINHLRTVESVQRSHLDEQPEST